MENIFSLQAQDGDLRKRYTNYKEDISVGLWFIPALHKIEGLSDIYFLIEDLRRKNETYCFIRGNPNEQRSWEESWRRKKIDSGDGFFTIDESKSWAMFDIDEITIEEGEEHNAQTLRQRLVRDIDFIEDDTSMIIDFSSSAQLYKKDDRPEKIWKAHIYVWFEEKIACKDLYYRLARYEMIDRSTILSNQCNFFEEPSFDETQWNCDIDKRTFLFEGKKCKLPEVSRFAPKNSGTLGSTLRETKKIDSNEHANALYQATQGIEGRYLATFKYFAYIINTSKNRDKAIQKVWEGENRWHGFKTKEDVENKMQDAWDFITKQYLPNITIGRHNLIELETDNLTKNIKEISKGVMLIKSPQSTYKTQLLKLIPKEASVLLITHRISLAQDIANQIDLFSYKDARCQEELLEQSRLAITHHSLHKLINTNRGYANGQILDDLQYDYVIIDESEQVLDDIMFTTLFDERAFANRDVFNYVGQFVQRAKTVYLADADLSDLSKLFLEIWRSDDEKFNIYQNDYRMGGKTVYGLLTPDLLLEKVYEDLRNNKRVFITCERKNAPYEMSCNIKARFPNANIIWINGDVPKTKYKELWNNPNKELPLLFNGQSQMNKGEFIGKDLNVLIVNSVMETGFSIGRKDDNKNRFHAVYGIFDNQHLIYTGSTMRQALRRVRNADRYYAHILNKRYYVRNIDEILEMIHGETYKDNDYESLRKRIARAKQISKENRKLNFIAHLEDCGWRYQEDDDIANFKEYFAQMQRVREEKEQELINAPKLTDEEFHDALKGSYLGEELSQKKYIVEKSFDSPITKKTIKRYRNGDIEKVYQVRDKLAEDIEILAKREGADDIFLLKSLRRLFSHFGLDFEKMERANKEVCLWVWQIDDELIKWFFEDGQAEALTFFLNTKYGLSLSATNYKNNNEDKLRFFVKIAKFFDFDCNYQDKNYSAIEEVRERCTFPVLKKHAWAWHREAKKEATRKKTKELSASHLELLDRFGGDIKKCRIADYIEKLQTAIDENKNLRPLEICFLKDYESHIIFRNYQKPQYTRFLTQFIFSYLNDIHSFDTTKNIINEFSQSTGENINDI